MRLLSILLMAAGLSSSTAALASAAPAKDRESILKMAGCNEITFDFKETFAMVPGYQFKAPYHNQALEYVVVDEDSGDRISLQHILVFRGAVQKHWRQEWTYEPESLFQFKGPTDGHATWDKATLAANERAGRWVQRVFNVDDSPRYECAAPWVHWGTNSYWECETGRPLPRREYTTRNDYQILQARNRHAIRADGWVLEEDNIKVAIENGKQNGLVKEKGENQNFKVDDSRCRKGAEYWTENRGTWHAIVAAWNQIYQANSTLKMITPAEGQPELYEVLFDLADRAGKAKTAPTQITTEAAQLIQPFFTK